MSANFDPNLRIGLKSIPYFNKAIDLKYDLANISKIHFLVKDL